MFVTEPGTGGCVLLSRRFKQTLEDPRTLSSTVHLVPHGSLSVGINTAKFIVQQNVTAKFVLRAEASPNWPHCVFHRMIIDRPAASKVLRLSVVGTKVESVPQPQPQPLASNLQPAILPLSPGHGVGPRWGPDQSRAEQSRSPALTACIN